MNLDRSPEASVLIPVLDEEAHIRETVAAMQAQRFDGGLEFLFMDGGSSDRTRQILEEVAAGDPRVRVLDNPGRRTPDALNVGLRHARGQYVARMDAHAWFPPDYVAKGVERLRRGDVAWVSGPAIPVGVGPWSRGVALALGSRLGRGGSSKWASDDRLCGEEVELDTGVFAGVWERRTVDAHGGWDEGWPVNQDSEMAARVRREGGRIVCLPDLGARYIPRDDPGSLFRQYWRYGFYRAKTARRHPDSLRRSALLAPGLALALLAAVLAPCAPARLARVSLGAYATAVLAQTAVEFRRDRAGDAATLLVVFPAIHLGWGLGFLWSCLSSGVPVSGIMRAAGLRSHSPGE